jgi:transmembrane sensor
MNMSNSPAGSGKFAPEDWERVARYLAREAPPQEMDSIRQWLDAEPERMRMINTLQDALASASGADDSAIDVEGALSAVKSRFASPMIARIAAPDTPTVSFRAFAPFLRAAAALLLVAGAGFLWRNMRESAATGGTKTFMTAVGERRQFTLADGTGVILGPASRLVVGANSDERTATLDGDAYFSVVHNPARPFTVKVGAVEITDVGTAFGIQTDDAGGVRLAVDSGSVSLGTHESDGSPKEVLGARDRARVNPSGVVLVERAAVSEDDVAWVKGRLVFRDAPLIEVGAELYRWYGVRLRVADSTLGNLHLTASFSGEPVDRVLNVIALSLGARLERQGNVATLYRAGVPGIRR